MTDTKLGTTEAPADTAPGGAGVPSRGRTRRWAWLFAGVAIGAIAMWTYCVFVRPCSTTAWSVDDCVARIERSGANADSGRDAERRGSDALDAAIGSHACRACLAEIYRRRDSRVRSLDREDAAATRGSGAGRTAGSHSALWGACDAILERVCCLRSSERIHFAISLITDPSVGVDGWVAELLLEWLEAAPDEAIAALRARAAEFPSESRPRRIETFLTALSARR